MLVISVSCCVALLTLGVFQVCGHGEELSVRRACQRPGDQQSHHLSEAEGLQPGECVGVSSVKAIPLSCSTTAAAKEGDKHKHLIIYLQI